MKVFMLRLSLLGCAWGSRERALSQKKTRRRKDSARLYNNTHTENEFSPRSELGNATVCVLCVHLSVSRTARNMSGADKFNNEHRGTLNGCAPSRVHFII